MKTDELLEKLQKKKQLIEAFTSVRVMIANKVNNVLNTPISYSIKILFYLFSL